MIRKKDGFQGERAVVLPPVLIKVAEEDELCRSLFVTDIGYYPMAEHHHRIREQAIDQYVLIYCVDGCGFYVLDDKRYEVRKNQFFVLPAYKPHEYGASKGHHWTIYWVHFRGDHAEVYAKGAAKPQDINITIYSRISDRIGIFEEILSTLHYGKEIEDLRYASSLLHHFLASMRYLSQFRRAKSGNGILSQTSAQAEKGDSPCNNPTADKSNIDIVKQAIHYMSENIENHIKMEEVLCYVGYSQSHFSTVFKKKTGMSPLSYFNKLKIDHACHLLRTTDMKVNQICYKVGIEDSLYFSRLFSKMVGMSPTAYKEKVNIEE